MVFLKCDKYNNVMVEREQQEERTAAVPETITRVLKETTLAELEVDTSYDNLNLASDKLSLAAFKEVGTGNIINIGFLHHPCAGEHFAQLLNSIAPFGGGGKDNILNDLRMPTRAKKDAKLGKVIKDSEYLSLHTRHLQDPQAGPFYKSFIAQHLKVWIDCLGSDASLDVFSQLQRVRFIDSVKAFTSQFFLEWKEVLPSEKDEKIRIYHISLTAFIYYQQGEPFVRYLSDKIPVKEGQSKMVTFDTLPVEQRRKHLDLFLEQLSEEEQGKFALADAVGREGRVLVDLKSKQVFPQKYYFGSAKVDFVDDRRIKIKDDKGTAVEVVPNKDIGGGRYDWKAVGYEFSSNYLAASRYPVIAWRKGENGQRQFLSQKEVRSYLRQLGKSGMVEAKKGDVKVGEAVVASFSPHIITQWKKRFPLKPLEKGKTDKFEQKMMGGQMPVWVAFMGHGEQLLSDNNPFFPKLEERIASAL